MIKIPERYHCNTGDQEPAYRMIDLFFGDVINEIGMPTDRPDPYSVRIHPHEQSDDITHTLLYQDLPVATVLETRDSMNWIDFTFFANLEGLVE